MSASKRRRTRGQISVARAGVAGSRGNGRGKRHTAEEAVAASRLQPKTLDVMGGAGRGRTGRLARFQSGGPLVDAPHGLLDSAGALSEREPLQTPLASDVHDTLRNRRASQSWSSASRGVSPKGERGHPSRTRIASRSKSPRPSPRPSASASA